MTKTAYIDFKAVRAALDFPTVLSHYGLEAEGTEPQLKIVCPFHDDHKPSCGVNTERNLFNCFSCGTSGNLMEFVALMEDHDPKTTSGLRQGALAALEVMGLDQADFTNNGGQRKGKSATKKSTKKPAKAKPEKQEDPDAEPEEEKPVNPPLSLRLQLDPEHAFFETRDLSLKVREQFGVGYCNKGIMAGRICIPIHNEHDELVAYAGRYASDDLPEDTPGYKMPKGFHKSHVLFNLNRLKTRNLKHVTIVEGYWSVMRLEREGIPAVATLGTSLSDQQVELIKSAGFKFVNVVFDGDEGGRKGAADAVAKLAPHVYVRAHDLPDGIKPDVMDEEYLNRLRIR